MMRRMIHTLAVTAVMAAALGATMAAQEADPMVGTWKLNVAKSTFVPGPPPKSGLVVIKQMGDKRNVALDLELSTGRMIHFEYTGVQDGSDTPVPGGGQVDTVQERRINIRTVARDDKKNGKVTRHQYSSVSVDGKTLTAAIAAINAEGVPVNDVQIYEKQ